MLLVQVPILECDSETCVFLSNTRVIFCVVLCVDAGEFVCNDSDREFTLTTCFEVVVEVTSLSWSAHITQGIRTLVQISRLPLLRPLLTDRTFGSACLGHFVIIQIPQANCTCFHIYDSYTGNLNVKDKRISAWKFKYVQQIKTVLPLQSTV